MQTLLMEEIFMPACPFAESGGGWPRHAVLGVVSHSRDVAFAKTVLGLLAEVGKQRHQRSGSAIGDQRLPDDELGVIGTEEGGQFGDVLRRAGAGDGDRVLCQIPVQLLR